MIKVVSLLCAAICVVAGAPLYGNDGGYAGYASYQPFKSQLKNSVSRSSVHSEDSIHAEAGSPDISRRPVRDHGYHGKPIAPKHSDTPDYRPSHQHSYGSNSVAHEIPSAPYAKATLYGLESGGYKLADAYQNKHAQLDAYGKRDYKDDYISNPQPYEYGYALKDEYGNTQHKKENSDGHGKVEGSYGFTDEHGLYRSVQYVADKEGFRATIKTNEPGTDNQDPADVHVESNQPKY